jgi:hypothetical protein
MELAMLYLALPPRCSATYSSDLRSTTIAFAAPLPALNCHRRQGHPIDRKGIKVLVLAPELGCY